MDLKMRDDTQQIIKFDHEKNFKDEDFYVSKSNVHILNLLNNWPKWEKNYLNVSGEKLSGKTHLINIFLKKFKGFKIEAQNLANDDLKEIKVCIGYNEGKKNGEFFEFYHDGVVWEHGYFTNGDYDGEYTTYFIDGKIKSSELYKKGDRIEATWYDNKGNIEYQN